MDITRIDEEFGEALRIARQAKGVTQEELSNAVEAMGIKLSQATIGKIERGERKVTVGESHAISRALRIWQEDLVRGISGATALDLQERLNKLRDEAKNALHAFQAGQALVAAQSQALEIDDRQSLDGAIAESLEALVEDYRRDRQVENEAFVRRNELDGDDSRATVARRFDIRHGLRHPRANAVILMLAQPSERGRNG